jgi:hypothetical protein
VIARRHNYSVDLGRVQELFRSRGILIQHSGRQLWSEKAFVLRTEPSEGSGCIWRYVEGATAGQASSLGVALANCDSRMLEAGWQLDCPTAGFERWAL